MTGKKASGEAAWVDPDDAPELTSAFFDRAEVFHGDTFIRRGRGRPTFGPVAFDQTLGNVLRRKAESRQLSTRDMTAAAGHDTVLIAPLCPSAMLFVPSVGGITHNPNEYSTKDQVALGAQVMLDTVLELAGGPASS